MLPTNKPKFERLLAVTKSLETIFKEKYKDNKKIHLIVRHETLESGYGTRIYRLWVEMMTEDVDERDIRMIDHIVQGQVEETQTYCLISEDEFEDLVFHDLEGNLITELIKQFYDKIL